MNTQVVRFLLLPTKEIINVEMPLRIPGPFTPNIKRNIESRRFVFAPGSSVQDYPLMMSECNDGVYRKLSGLLPDPFPVSLAEYRFFVRLALDAGIPEAIEAWR